MQGGVRPQQGTQGAVQQAPQQNNQGGAVQNGGQPGQGTNPTNAQPQGTTEETNQ